MQNHTWTLCKNSSGAPIGRDDHSLFLKSDASLVTFGGFATGSRTNDIYEFSLSGD